MAMTRPSPSSDDNLEKEAGRELAAFLRAVEETQGAESVEKAGTIWIDILNNRHHTDFCSQSSFRSITVEAAGSLVALLGQASPTMQGGPECEASSIDQSQAGRIHLVAKPVEKAVGDEDFKNPVLLFGEYRRRTGSGELDLVS
jgi:hypothetical protein